MSKDIILIYLTACGIISYLPQIIKIIRTKSSKDISISTWFIWSFNSSLYLIYLLLSEVDLLLIITQVVEVLFIVITLIISIVYNKSIFKRSSDLNKDESNN